MTTVLVSFIGAGSLSGNQDTKSKYETTEYHFDIAGKQSITTSIFGSALLEYLKKTGRSVERWLIMGTSQSIWCDLIEMFGEVKRDEILFANDENLQLWARLYREAEKDKSSRGEYVSQICQADLDKWQELLTPNLGGTEVVCRLVGTATKTDSQKKVFESLLEVVADGNKVVFDMTHGLRNQPIITSFALMYLRWLRNVRDVEFYYGALELNGEVVKLDFCREILEATEAVAIFKQTGSFHRIGEQIGLSPTFQQDLETLAFSDEMLRLKHGVAQKVKNELGSRETLLLDHPLKSSLAEKLKESLKWSEERLFATRLKEKAAREFEHKQYFKAIASLWEAVLIAGCRKFGLKNPKEWADRNEAKDQLYQFFQGKAEFQDLKNLEHLRNAVLHGSDSGNRDVRKAVENFEKFKQVFERGLVLVNEILK
jgi:cell division protein DivIC